MYKYQCTARFTTLIFLEGSLEQIRPQQIITLNGPVTHQFLKLLSPLPKTEKVDKVEPPTIKRRRKTPETIIDGRSTKPSSSERTY